MNKILTLDNLYSFFVAQNQTVNFNSKESGKPIVVTTNGLFEAEDSDMPEMLKLKLKVCHTKQNRNGSFISDENMEKAMPTLKYRPILAYIHDTPSGEKDFYAHNVEFIENEDGETEIVYTEKQVGCFTADNPWLEYDKKMDKNYVMAYAVVPEGYTETADIIRRKGGTKVSCELIVNELEYNAKEKYLEITDFVFGGCTLLGQDEEGNEIGEGMLGARADITDFCHKEPVFNYQDKLIETLEKLNFTLENINKENSGQKGGENMKLEELLAKYNVTIEDVTFEIEGLSDEELEVKFAEVFDESTSGDSDDANGGEGEPAANDGDGEPIPNDGDGATADDGDGDSDPKGNGESVTTETEACGGKKRHKKCSVDENGDMILTWELSHDDIRCALYNLIEIYDEEDNDYYGIREVYDDYFLMQSWFSNRIYKQGYSVDGDNVALEGDRQEMFELIVSESEKIAIEKMREDYADLEAKYAELQAFKANIDAAELKSKKDAIFAKLEYECLADNADFKSLIADAEKFSVDEINTKADLIFAAYMKSTMEFSAKENKPKTIGFNFNTKNERKSPYGGLFDKK